MSLLNKHRPRIRPACCVIDSNWTCNALYLFLFIFAQGRKTMESGHSLSFLHIERHQSFWRLPLNAPLRCQPFCLRGPMRGLWRILIRASVICFYSQVVYKIKTQTNGIPKYSGYVPRFNFCFLEPEHSTQFFGSLVFVRMECNTKLFVLEIGVRAYSAQLRQAAFCIVPTLDTSLKLTVETNQYPRPDTVYSVQLTNSELYFQFCSRRSGSVYLVLYIGWTCHVNFSTMSKLL